MAKFQVTSMVDVEAGSVREAAIAAVQATGRMPPATCAVREQGLHLEAGYIHHVHFEPAELREIIAHASDDGET